jgi:hypothetical protein
LKYGGPIANGTSFALQPPATRRVVCAKSHWKEIIMASNDKANNDQQLDQDRFNKLKEMETERGRDEKTAKKVAAKEVEALREREGRTKENEA